MKAISSKLALYFGITLLVTVSTMFAVMGMPIIPLFILGGLIGVLIVYYCLTQPLIGFYIVTIISFFTAYPERLLKVSLPLTTGIEVLVLLIFLGTFSNRHRSQQGGGLLKTPTTLAFFIYILLICVEFFNPNMHSIGGWFFFVRRFSMFMLLYTLGYWLFDDMKKIKAFFKLWFGLALLAAGYSCFQQWFGMTSFEMDYLMSHPHEYKLYFQGGNIKKFSFLSDPTTFGIMAGACSAFMLVMAINEKKTKKRRLYFLVFFILLIGMSYSGTRTTNIMLPAALCLYGLMTITNKKTLITLLLFIVGATFIMFGPIENKTINRVRSTFNSKEESLEVRDINRKYIQPYIYAHPLGGGIATSGVQGEKYNLGHPLAGFPPDSGFLLAAIELGWIGYAITILVFFLILYQCVHYYFITSKEENKTLIISITVALFSIIITQYSQVSLGQLPTALFFYASLALVVRLKELGNYEEQ
jgi:putative inorganic carbon (HCO3(-)) transporter